MNPSATTFSAALAWDSGFLHRSLLFEPLRPVGHELAACADWPKLTDLQRLAETRAKQAANQAGKPICFVPPHDQSQRFEDEYEPRTFLAGEVQTRAENWHDLFNALVWLAFPKSKAVINARHYAEMLREREAAEGKVRGKLRDRLTQFDESGVVILCADAQLSQLLAEHQWQQLFWHDRARVAHAMRFLVFGHSLYEKALQPYPGITGKALVLPLAAHALDQPLDEVVSMADGLLAQVLADAEQFGAATTLQPLPLMGVPGWTPENENSAYYQDTRYFRPKP